MAILDVTIKGHLRLDDDLLESFKVQETEDQIRGFLDEGQDVKVSVQKNEKLTQQEEEERRREEALKAEAAKAKEAEAAAVEETPAEGAEEAEPARE